MSRTNEHSSMEPELGREQSFHLNDEASANPDVMHLEMIDEADRMTDDQNKHAVKGDDSDGKIDWTVRSFIAAMTLCIFYSASQLPLYFSAGALSIIASDLKAADRSSWLPVSYTLASEAPLPLAAIFRTSSVVVQ
ncbi:hypothetical protein DL95DRAFT_488238 [Leptodontidium sp. 2 PMI_412]|nr:hypothetical protein BKA61DRAFT_671920 [Leptodontidium sp. MPI-SDFR-AT-0119]KAH9206194.1 hypothetical protein DL95DRAFT_488238 [Leptodontidium sp. 2 PMI_412]